MNNTLNTLATQAEHSQDNDPKNWDSIPYENAMEVKETYGLVSKQEWLELMAARTRILNYDDVTAKTFMQTCGYLCSRSKYFMSEPCALDDGITIETREIPLVIPARTIQYLYKVTYRAPIPIFDVTLEQLTYTSPEWTIVIGTPAK